MSNRNGNWEFCEAFMMVALQDNARGNFSYSRIVVLKCKGPAMSYLDQSSRSDELDDVMFYLATAL